MPTMRRAFVTTWIAGLFAGSGSVVLFGCTQPSGGQQVVPIAPPTFAQVKAFLASFAPSLPVLISELENTGSLRNVNTDRLDQVVRDFEALTNQFLQMNNPDTSIELINEIGSLAALIMSFIPAAAPFVPVLVLLQAMIAAYVANRPVTNPNGDPMPVPQPISQPTLTSLHRRTLSFRRAPGI